MALTRRTDGTQAANLVNAAWWNDYYDLFTGAMTDQAVTVANSLTLKSTNAAFAWQGTLNATDRTALQVKPADTGRKEYDLVYRASDDHLVLKDATDATTVADFSPTGATDFPLGVTNKGKAIAVQGSHSSGQPVVSWGTGQPAALDANEIFIQFS